MILLARLSPDMVYEYRGWHIAKYLQTRQYKCEIMIEGCRHDIILEAGGKTADLSVEKATMVNTDEYDVLQSF